MAPKQVKSAGDSDRIGGLPDAILSHILSFLPTKEAIRTTVLSPRWRYLFASMSTFDFTDCLKRMTPKNGNNFKNFVDRLLSFPNPVSLESFGLLHPGWEKDDSHLYGWISAILSRGVKQLDLCTPVSSMLSSHMFNSQSLVSLKLYPNGFIEVPAKICLPNLKTLFLIEITIVDDSIFRLISSCNVLEELVLTPISDDLLLVSEIIIRNPSLKSLILNVLVRTPKHVTHVEIDAPNLVRLDYSDDLVERYTLSNMESLEKAYIKINYSGEHDPTYLLQAMHNVQALHLSVDLDTTFSQTGLEPVFAFNNLVELELVSPLGEWLVEFLHCVPNLKTLILFQVLAAEGFKFIPRKLPSCLSFHLKEITFTDYKIRKLMFETICYFLNHALVLEKLRVSIVKEYHPREETCVFKMLLRLLRFSIDNQYSIELSSSVKKLLRLFRIGINELYSREESSIIKKLLRLPRGRAIEVSVELKEEM